MIMSAPFVILIRKLRQKFRTFEFVAVEALWGDRYYRLEYDFALLFGLTETHLNLRIKRC